MCSCVKQSFSPALGSRSPSHSTVFLFLSRLSLYAYRFSIALHMCHNTESDHRRNLEMDEGKKVGMQGRNKGGEVRQAIKNGSLIGISVSCCLSCISHGHGSAFALHLIEGR